MASSLKSVLSHTIAMSLRGTAKVRKYVRRIWAHAHLASHLSHRLPASVVVLGRAQVYGSGDIAIGEDALLYPGLYLETEGAGSIRIGDGVVISTGCHIVSRTSVTIGRGSMIGEFACLRDANHVRSEDRPIRDSGHVAKPIVIGEEVWIGRSAAILAGVTIGDYATIGANAVVTRDVPARAIVAGVPARAIESRQVAAKDAG